MCQFFRWDRRCPLGGGVGVELVKWDFGSSVVVAGIRLRKCLAFMVGKNMIVNIVQERGFVTMADGNTIV